jgi:hypothetical protein
MNVWSTTAASTGMAPDDYIFMPHLKNREHALAVLNFFFHWDAREDGARQRAAGPGENPVLPAVHGDHAAASAAEQAHSGAASEGRNAGGAVVVGDRGFKSEARRQAPAEVLGAAETQAPRVVGGAGQGRAADLDAALVRIYRNVKSLRSTVGFRSCDLDELPLI